MSIAPNKYKGEFVIKIGNEEYLVRANFKAIYEMEIKAECGIFELIENFRNRDFKTRDILAVLWGGLVGAKSDMTFDELAEKILKYGVIDLVKPATEFLILTINEK